MSSDAVDAYIAGFDPPVREVLERARALVHEAVPGLSERISYRIATFDLAGGYVVYLAGHASHVGMHPATDDDLGDLADAAAPYRHGKGTLRFAIGQPLPDDLIGEFVRRRAATRGWAPPDE